MLSSAYLVRYVHLSRVRPTAWAYRPLYRAEFGKTTQYLPLENFRLYDTSSVKSSTSTIGMGF